VAVIALFKEIGAPKRLVTLVDGESVFNDATAIVLFGIVLAAAGTGARPDLINGAGQFVPVLAGGVLIGGLVGLGVSFAFLLDRRGLVFQKTLSLLAAYASFLLADRVFHLSGVMSTLAAGLVIRWRAETAVHPSHIENIEHAWSFFAFVANSFVFILLGLTEVHLLLYKGNILSHLPAVLISIPLVLAARALCVWGVLPAWNLAARRRGIETVPASWQAVIFWGGLRGAVPVALVLAIPADFPNRETIVHATMANILFTLLVQGTTVKWLMERLGIRPEPTKAG
jgi:CPA1 family monovalent cation:H+ antiporter